MIFGNKLGLWLMWFGVLCPFGVQALMKSSGMHKKGEPGPDWLWLFPLCAMLVDLRARWGSWGSVGGRLLLPWKRGACLMGVSFWMVPALMLHHKTMAAVMGSEKWIVVWIAWAVLTYFYERDQGEGAGQPLGAAPTLGASAFLVAVFASGWWSLHRPEAPAAAAPTDDLPARLKALAQDRSLQDGAALERLLQAAGIQGRVESGQVTIIQPVSRGNPSAQRNLALTTAGKLATACSVRGVSRLSLELRLGSVTAETGEIDMNGVKRSNKQVGEPLDAASMERLYRITRKAWPKP